eukprot:scaffold820_cov227-Pinguiococcus_pyrenoidosus.AAC.10
MGHATCAHLASDLEPESPTRLRLVARSLPSGFRIFSAPRNPMASNYETLRRLTGGMGHSQSKARRKPTLLQATARFGTADRPREGRLHRSRLLVNVVPVQAQAGLQAQRVASTKASGTHRLVIQQRRCHGGSIGLGRADLKAVFPGVPAARHTASEASHRRVRRGHERHLGEVQALGETLKHRHGTRPLQRQQLLRVQILKAAVAFEALQLLLEVRDVAGLGRPVHHHVVVVSLVADHRVVDDASVGVGQEAQAALLAKVEVSIWLLTSTSSPLHQLHMASALPRSWHHHKGLGGAASYLAWLQSQDVSHADALQKAPAVRAMPPQLAHMSHVEEGRLASGATVQMLRLHAGELDGQLVAGERHHLSAELLVQLEQSGAAELRHLGALRVRGREVSGWCSAARRSLAQLCGALGAYLWPVV